MQVSFIFEGKTEKKIEGKMQKMSSFSEKEEEPLLFDSWILCA